MIPRLAVSTFAMAAVATLALANLGLAQGPGGGGLPNTPPTPPQNPITPAKTNLGKVLFWDEQLSSSDTVACGTCHASRAGGTDGRAGTSPARVAGPDGQLNTADDIIGTVGVQHLDTTVLPLWDALFGLDPQITGRWSPPTINAAFNTSQFYDGRAGGTFVDPTSGATIILNGASLETQILQPPVSGVEMGHDGRDWNMIAGKITNATPMRLAASVPAALNTWIAGRTYPQLFQEAFGTPDVTPVRIAMAIATYERALVSNQTPFNQFLQGVPGVLTQEEARGEVVFRTQGRCLVCHPGPRATDDSFRYTGVRPQNDDLGRFNVTGNPGDRGRMKVPNLLNLELRDRFFHNGGMATIEQVIDFYNRGGDFTAPNKDPNIVPLGLTPQQRADLAAFLRRPFTDQRVAQGLAPFDDPVLYAQSNRVPTSIGAGTPGANLRTPRMIALEPPYAGNPGMAFSIVDGTPGKKAILCISPTQIPGGAVFQGANLYVPTTGLQVVRIGALNDAGNGRGWGRAQVAIPNNPVLVGTQRTAQWVVIDNVSATQRLAASNAVQYTIF